MRESFNPFDYPEINDLFEKLFTSLFKESGRGAILIATTHVEDHLTKLIESALPSDISKKNKDRLFAYPGPLSSFAAKINLSYAFRIISQTMYDSLTALRTIRNTAAHDASEFSLHELNDKMRQVYNLGPAIPNYIKDQAVRSMMNLKIESIKQIFDEQNLSEEERKVAIDNLLNKPDTIASLEKQVPYWELLCGLCFICGMLSYHREELSAITSMSTTWGGLTRFVNNK